jgi:hypothetical protein
MMGLKISKLPARIHQNKDLNSIACHEVNQCLPSKQISENNTKQPFAVGGEEFFKKFYRTKGCFDGTQIYNLCLHENL